eukprot:TRINITY_DN17990_c0_g2_i1.p1 TRINITY_DN17990_c0_g2~~TRINITY_DN17990_c0_g2_i1.p1  ORF type:complete len:394 (-),score=16.99 TRINITY_DN17990_c0_g2_i1:429-1565(-)
MHSVLTGFVYFYSYSFIKTRYLAASRANHLGLLANLAVAASAGACTAVVTQPWDTIAARMQTSRPGESKGFLAMLREGGLSHAFDGLGVSLLLTSNPAIQYTVFEQLKGRMLRRSASSDSKAPAALSALSAFLLGALAKTIATVATYPAIRCKVMMQRAESDEEKRRKAAGDKTAGAPATMLLAMRVIWKTEGLPGFYKGLQAQILKTVLAAALMLMIKEKVAAGSQSLVMAVHRLASSLTKPSAAGATSAAAAPAAALKLAPSTPLPAAASAAAAAAPRAVPVVSAPASVASTASPAPMIAALRKPSATSSSSPSHSLVPALLPPPTSALHAAAAFVRPISLYDGAGTVRAGVGSRVGGVGRNEGLVYRGSGSVAEL